MKLTPITNPTPTYPITIVGSVDDTDKTPTTLDYTSFQSIPNEYALVARRKASTDIGTNTEGSSFKTTYQAYAALGQAAGTYEGQVRYTLVHPYNHAVPDPPSFKVLYTADGQYDKLAPDTLYGGYFTYGGTLDEFEAFLKDYEIYNGPNID